MAGHSKWKQIKHKKGIKDQKRAQVFAKLSKLITMAVGEGGGIADPNLNVKLRLAVEKAKASNMPKENIERAMERASGPGGELIKEVFYEAFAPHGVSLIISAITDNSNRTIAEIKNVLEKNGGKLGVQGSVAYLYDKDYNPTYLIKIENREEASKILRLIDALENLDDVSQVYSNFDIPEELVSSV